MSRHPKDCVVAYEVAKYVQTIDRVKSVVFNSKKMARMFQAKNVGSKITPVLLCDGRIKRRGKRSYDRVFK